VDPGPAAVSAKNVVEEDVRATSLQTGSTDKTGMYLFKYLYMYIFDQILYINTFALQTHDSWVDTWS